MKQLRNAIYVIVSTGGLRTQNKVDGLECQPLAELGCNALAAVRMADPARQQQRVRGERLACTDALHLQSERNEVRSTMTC